MTDLGSRGRSPAFQRPAPPRRGPAARRRARATLSGALVVADIVMAILVLLGVHGDARAIGGLAFCLVVPGWAIIGLLRLDNPPLEIALTMSAGIAALTLVAQLAISLGAWHLDALQVLVCALCLPSLCVQALDRARLGMAS